MKADPEQIFLFMFGLESPAESFSNERDGTDFESSWSFLITASSAEAALAWDRRVAEEFVRRLFERDGAAPPSWIAGSFAHWLSDSPAELADALGDPSVLRTPDGEMPDLSSAVAYWAR